MALNSMWQIAWISAARPATVNGERCGTCVGATRFGCAGRPGRPGGSGMSSFAIEKEANCDQMALDWSTFP
jgi:hypothetical protein